MRLASDGKRRFCKLTTTDGVVKCERIDLTKQCINGTPPLTFSRIREYRVGKMQHATNLLQIQRQVAYSLRYRICWEDKSRLKIETVLNLHTLACALKIVGAPKRWEVL
jgi:hypothetical protein